MKKKIVLSGTREPEEKVIMALELLPESNKVSIAIYPEPAVTEEVDSFLYKEWKNNDSANLPEGYEMMDRELTVVDSVLPDNLKPNDTELLIRTQTEWQFIVLSTKMKTAFQEEIQELNEKIDSLESYSADTWNSLKDFWGKVQQQISERNLFRNHGTELRENTNALFDKMKVLRKEADKEFDKVSAETKAFFTEAIAGIEAKIEGGTRLNSLFDELKDLQGKFRNAKMSKNDRSSVWNILDGAFKKVKEKKYGSKPNAGNNSPVERLKRRYDGLLAALKKMDNSIQRDKKDLEYENRRISQSDGQLERQIRQAKIAMIEQRFNSKSEKLADMQKTKADLEAKIKKAEERQARELEKQQKQAAKEEIKAKLAQEIEAKKDSLGENETQKLKVAAEKVFQASSKTEPADKASADKTNEDSVVDRIITISSIL